LAERITKGIALIESRHDMVGRVAKGTPDASARDQLIGSFADGYGT
jgi:hypothetical protein